VKLTLEWGGEVFQSDTEAGIDLSVPLNFLGDQINFYGVPKAEARIFEGGGFIGDTKRGGSCNVREIHFNPHCHGTHTEAVSHVVDEPIAVFEILKSSLMTCAVVSVEIESAKESGETYPTKENADQFVTAKAFNLALDAIGNPKTQAIAIRTLPNDDSKRTRHYEFSKAPAFLTTDAMKQIVQRRYDHLLIDLPSADKMNDQGKLSNHRMFWNLNDSGHKLNAEAFRSKTITEIIYVPKSVSDGVYLLDLQIIPFLNDACPSRPMIYPVQKGKR